MGKYAQWKHTWGFVTAAPPREVFAVMEQLLGIPPYRYEVVGEDQARVVEAERRGFFGTWRKPRRNLQQVGCRASVGDAGTEVELRSTAKAAPRSRAEQLVRLLSQGISDRRGIYRDRRFDAGPVSLVASWAGMGYRLYSEPSHDSSRGAIVHTATPMYCTGDAERGFVKVRLEDGTEGYVEKDQVVPAPAVSSRAAQVTTARGRT